MVFCTSKGSCLLIQPQILLEVSRGLSVETWKKHCNTQKRLPCLLHSSPVLGGDLLCILLAFRVSGAVFSLFLHCERKGTWPAPRQAVLPTIQ